MNSHWTTGNQPGTREEGSGVSAEAAENETDPMLDAVLTDFRASVHAWSDASYSSRALVLPSSPRRALVQRSLLWALSLLLTAGIATAGVHEYQQRELARQQVQRDAEHQRQLAIEQHAREADELLARVDSDVSREVPSAMEPLASLMAEDETR